MKLRSNIKWVKPTVCHIKKPQYAAHFHTDQQLFKAVKLALAYVIVFDQSSSALLCEFIKSYI